MLLGARGGASARVDGSESSPMIDTSNLTADGSRSCTGYSAYNSHVSPRTTSKPKEVHLMLEPSPPSYRAPPASARGTYYTRVLEDAGVLDDQPGTSRSDHERAPMSPSWRGGSPYQGRMERQTAVAILQSRVMKLQRLVTSERQNCGELRELLDRGERKHRQRELELGQRIHLLRHHLSFDFVRPARLLTGHQILVLPA